MTINEKVQLDAINGKMFPLTQKQFEVILEAAHFGGEHNSKFRQDCALFLVGTKTWGEIQKYF
jgi:hypothetical protein